MITPIRIPPTLQVSAPGYPPELVDVVDFNNEHLVPWVERLAEMNRDGRRYMRHHLQFVRGAWSLTQLYHLIQRYAPPAGNPADANALMNELERFYGQVVELFRTYPPLQISHPTFWSRRETLCEDALVLLDYEYPTENRGRTSVLAAAKRFFDDDSERARLLQSQIQPYLDRNFIALKEQLAQTPSADAMLDKVEAALRRWESSSHQVSSATNAVEVLLFAGGLISASVGNMADPGDSFAIGLLRFRIWRTVSTQARVSDEVFSANAAAVARAAGVDASRVERLLRITPTMTSEQQRANYEEAHELLTGRYHTQFGLSLVLSCISALQLMSMLASFDEPTDNELQRYIETGQAAYFTGANLVVTLDRGVATTVGAAISELSLARRMVSWLSTVNRGAIAIFSGYGVGHGLREALDGWRDGDAWHVAAGGVGAAANVAIGVAAVAELAGWGIAAAASGWGIVLGAAALAIGVAITLRDNAEAREEARRQERYRRLATTGRNMDKVVRFLLWEAPDMSVDGVDARALWSRSERNPDHRSRRFHVAGRDPEPPPAQPTHLKMITVIDREAGTELATQLQAILQRIQALVFSPLEAHDASEARQLYRALTSLGFDTTNRAGRDMVRLNGQWIALPS